MNERDIRTAIQKVREALGPSRGVVFMPVAVGAALGLAACPNPFSHSVAVYGDDDDIITTTHSTTTHSTTSTGTTTSTSAECGADLTEATGATAECNTCVQDNCCQEAQAYLAAPTKETLLALYHCAVWDPSQVGPCFGACPDATCGSTPRDGSEFFYACNQCIAASGCCSTYGTCLADDACRNSCIYGDDASCCEPGSLYKPYDDCLVASCSYVCPAAFTCSESHQGQGGGGGSGGTGGSGAVGGAGGSAGAPGGGGAGG